MFVFSYWTIFLSTFSFNQAPSLWLKHGLCKFYHAIVNRKKWGIRLITSYIKFISRHVKFSPECYHNIISPTSVNAKLRILAICELLREVNKIHITWKPGSNKWWKSCPENRPLKTDDILCSQLMCLFRAIATDVHWPQKGHFLSYPMGVEPEPTVTN